MYLGLCTFHRFLKLKYIKITAAAEVIEEKFNNFSFEENICGTHRLLIHALTQKTLKNSLNTSKVVILM